MRPPVTAPSRQNPINTFAAWWDFINVPTTVGRVRYMLRNSWTIIRASPNQGDLPGLLHFLASKTSAQIRRYQATEAVLVKADSNVKDIIGCWVFREIEGTSPRFEVQCRVEADTPTSRGIMYGVPRVVQCNVLIEVNGCLVPQ